MKYSIVNLKVSSLAFSNKPTSDDQEKRNHIRMNYTLNVGESPDKAVLALNVFMTAESGFNLTFVYEFTFKFDEDMTEESLREVITDDSSFAVTYPYVRAYISSITSLSGYMSVNLPIDIE